MTIASALEAILPPATTDVRLEDVTVQSTNPLMLSAPDLTPFPCDALAPAAVGQRGVALAVGRRRVWLGPWGGGAVDLTIITNRLAAVEGWNADNRLTSLEAIKSGTRLTNLENLNAGTRLTALEADTGWIAATNASGVSGTLQARTLRRVTYLRGRATNSANWPANTWTTVCTLPVGTRPSQATYTTAATRFGLLGAYLTPEGLVRVNPWTLATAELELASIPPQVTS